MKKWKIIFLLYKEYDASENTYNNLIDPIDNQIKDIPFYDNCEILLIGNSVIKDRGFPICDYTKVYRKKEEGLFGEVKTFPFTNGIFNADKLATVFNFIHLRFPSEKIFLSSIGHGSAYGIFKKEYHTTTLSNSLLKKDSTALVHIKKTLKNHWEGSHVGKSETESAYQISDPSSFTAKLSIYKNKSRSFILSNDTLAKAISSGFKQKLDILAMVNCAMQNVHSCYALQYAVHYFIAPEGTISLPAFEYTKLINNIQDDVEISARSLAYKAIQSIDSMRSFDFKPLKIQKSALFAIDLSGYEEFINLFRSYLLMLTGLFRSNRKMKQELRLIRDKCYPHDIPHDYYMIDLLSWCWGISQRFPAFDLLKENFKKMSTSYHAITVNSFIGVSVYYELGYCLEKMHGIAPSGTTIHFPPNNKIDKMYLSENGEESVGFSSNFFEDTGWSVFLRELNSVP